MPSIRQSNLLGLYDNKASANLPFVVHSKAFVAIALGTIIGSCSLLVLRQYWVLKNAALLMILYVSTSETRMLGSIISAVCKRQTIQYYDSRLGIITRLLAVVYLLTSVVNWKIRSRSQLATESCFLLISGLKLAWSIVLLGIYTILNSRLVLLTYARPCYKP